MAYSRLHGFCTTSDTHVPVTPDYTICDLHTVYNPEWSSFSVYMIPEWNFIAEQEFHSLRLKTGMTCVGTKRLFSHRVKKYKKIILRWGELVPEWKSFWYHVNSPLLPIQTVHSALFFCTIVRINFQMYHFKFTLGRGENNI